MNREITQQKPPFQRVTEGGAFAKCSVEHQSSFFEVSEGVLVLVLVLVLVSLFFSGSPDLFVDRPCPDGER